MHAAQRHAQAQASLDPGHLVPTEPFTLCRQNTEMLGLTSRGHRPGYVDPPALL